MHSRFVKRIASNALEWDNRKERFSNMKISSEEIGRVVKEANYLSAIQSLKNKGKSNDG